MKMLSLKRARPTMLIALRWTRSTSMKSSPVNWLPYSVNTSGRSANPGGSDVISTHLTIFAASSRSRAAPSPRQALPCMHANTAGLQAASFANSSLELGVYA
jgi:hypothetical protein